MQNREHNASHSPCGRRTTRQKALILECLKRMKGRHVTAEELAEALKRGGTPVGKATVYRYLGELEAAERLKRYRGAENGPACYQYIDAESGCGQHYHLLCETCGEIVHFESDALESALQKLNEGNGFTINPTKIVFYGICKNCRVP